MAERQYFLGGEIDAATAPALRADLSALTGDNGDDVTVDCSALVFIDSAGVAPLRATRLALAGEGRRFRIVNANALTERILGVHGLADHLRGRPDQVTSTPL